MKMHNVKKLIINILYNFSKPGRL